MPDILSQDEIDEILARIEKLSSTEVDALLNALMSNREPLIPLIVPRINNLEDFAEFIVYKETENSFADSHINTFQGNHIVVDKWVISNAYTQSAVKEPKAIVKIGNIEIIPINICPSCKNFHYDEEVQEIYAESKPSREFASKNERLKEYELIRKWKSENRTICCKKCKIYFQPTIVYSETENSDPYLCKQQTIKALDDWFQAEKTSKLELFSLKTETIQFERYTATLFWDVFLSEYVNGMETCPRALLTSIARYTPLEHLEKMLNREKRIPVFNSYNFKSYYYKPTQIFEKLSKE